MGHQSQMRAYRKQVRNVAIQNYPDFLREESVKAFEKQALEVIGTRLDQVAENVEKQLKIMDDQNKQFRSYLMKDASHQISRELTNISVTMLAWQEVLVAKLNLDDVAAFTAEVEAKKAEVFARLETEAKAQTEAAQKAADEAKAKEEELKAAEAGEQLDLPLNQDMAETSPAQE